MPDKEPHGNSKESRKPQHVYEIIDADKELTLKYGISGQSLNADGTSPRANEQVQKLNIFAGVKRFFANILEKNIENREKALEIEQEYVNRFVEQHKQMPEKQKRPRPNSKNT